MDPLTSTADHTDASASVSSPAAQTAPASTSSTSSIPSTSPTPPSSNGRDEERIRYFQSLADKREAEARAKDAEARTLAEKVRQQEQLLAELQGNQKAVLEGAAMAAQQAMQRAQAIQEQLEAEKAARMKAEALQQHPELREYAAFIPETTDAEKLKFHLETFKAARERDLASVAAQQQQQQQTTPSAPTAAAPRGPDLRGLYPAGSGIDLASLAPQSPARPSGSASGVSTADTIAQTLRDAMDDPKAFAQKIREMAALAETSINQQVGR